MKKASVYLFFLLCIIAGCKKKEDAAPEPLYKRWYLYQIERLYTDDAGNPHPDFKSWSDVVDDKEMYIEFNSDGKMLTYEGNGTYVKNGNTISYSLPNNTGEYQYSLQGNQLILFYTHKGISYTEKATFTMKPL